MHRTLHTLLRILKWRATPLVFLLALGPSILGGTIFMSAVELVLQALQGR